MLLYRNATPRNSGYVLVVVFYLVRIICIIALRIYQYQFYIIYYSEADKIYLPAVETEG
jgi:hypothetical protein